MERKRRHELGRGKGKKPLHEGRESGALWDKRAPRCIFLECGADGNGRIGLGIFLGWLLTFTNNHMLARCRSIGLQCRKPGDSREHDQKDVSTHIQPPIRKPTTLWGRGSYHGENSWSRMLGRSCVARAVRVSPDGGMLSKPTRNSRAIANSRIPWEDTVFREEMTSGRYTVTVWEM